MRDDPFRVEGAWALRPGREQMPWWRRLLGWWPVAGRLTLGDGALRWSPAELVEVRLDLHRPWVTALNFWPRDWGRGWLGVKLRQGGAEVAFQVSQPWSAIPDNTAALMSQAPTMASGDFAVLWGALRDMAQVHGELLPVVEEGLYEDQAREVQLIGLKPRRVRASRGPVIPQDQPYPTPPSKQRDMIKAFVRPMNSEHFVHCPFCGVAVKVKNIVRHCDHEHQTAQWKWL